MNQSISPGRSAAVALCYSWMRIGEDTLLGVKLPRPTVGGAEVHGLSGGKMKQVTHKSPVPMWVPND